MSAPGSSEHPPAREWSRLRRHDPDRGDAAGVLDLGRLLLGAVVIGVGALFLLDAAGVLDAGEVIGDWWPLPIVIAGLLTLAERPPAVVRGLVVTGIGILALLFTTDVLEGNAWDYIWPALIIVAGIAIALRWHGRAIPKGASEEDVVRSTAVFGGPELVCGSQRFRGAWLTAVFGGISLDLRDARPAPGGASINATAAFGGIDILVPRGWALSVRSMPILGGVADETDHAASAGPDAPVLHIDAVTFFGGVSIKHEK